MRTNLVLVAPSAALLLLLSACGARSFETSEGKESYRDCLRLANAGACVSAANMLRTGVDADQDVDRAFELYDRACQNGNYVGCDALGSELLATADLAESERAFAALERSCHRYNIHACDVLIRTYSATGSPHFDPDRGEAIRQRLCDDGFLTLCWVDSDGDGIEDNDDACPEVAEDVDGFEDADGCPDPDNDADGLLDADDQCPDEAEDADGFEDADGCPDPDNDADGVLDADDQCPTDAEDVDGFEDEDGCPDPDNDGDGLLDADDQCPDEAEDYDGFEDNDGCPEEGVGLVQLTCEAIIINDVVYFATGSDVIEERSFPLLDQVAGVLRGATFVTLVEVAGHTDDRGRDDANLDLSQRRAASVRNYLVAAGLEPERLRSEGYGETRPIQPNTTADGRAANRRVEFVIVERAAGCGDAPAAGGDAAGSPETSTTEE
ncbi:MAG: OmpA family protein [Myxococcales bacterium]|nr:OmpA family protein [Myxococcales bacterium]MCB9520720.1 OmpA family protein [Myxococcales bacterium]MCB9532124.1 OmpA family protein [Myxococcales bacterium]